MWPVEEEERERERRNLKRGLRLRVPVTWPSAVYGKRGKRGHFTVSLLLLLIRVWLILCYRTRIKNASCQNKACSSNLLRCWQV